MEPSGPVLDVVLPVYGLVAAGWVACRAGAIGADDLKRFTQFTFVVFVPAQLFLAMARTDFARLQAGVPLAYFAAAFLTFGAVVALRARRVPLVRATVDGLAASFSNTVMIGIPMVQLGWGETALAMLLSIVALHSLLLLSTATLLFEIASAGGSPLVAAGRGLKAALLHPVILPILAGAAWNLLGLPRPAAMDATLGLLAGAASPLCLVLLGASLGRDGLATAVRGALALSGVKLIAMPALAAAVGVWVLGLPPLALTVVVLTAALPTGANVFLFAQRYSTGTGPISAAVFGSTLLAAPVLAVLLPMLPVPPR